MIEKTTKKFRIYMLLLGSLSLFTAGVFYAWSILKAPFSFSAAELGLNFTVSLCAFGFGGLFSGLLAKKVNVRIRLIFGAILAALGLVLATYAESSVALLIASYGLTTGLGIGIIYNAVIGTVNSWFPDRKGFSSGVLLMSFGISTLVLGKISDAFFGLESIGWKKTYYLLASLILISAIALSLIARMPNENDSLPAPKQKKSADSTNDFSASQTLRRFSFWKLFIFFTLFSAVGSASIGFAKDFLTDAGASSSFAVTMVGIVSVCNGLGRLLSGYLFDNIGLRKTQFLTSAVVILATSTALVGALTSSLPVCIIGICLCGLSYGFSPTVSAAFIASFYGMKSYASNLGVINLVLIPASFMSTLAGKIGDFTIVFALLLALSLVGLVINLTIKKP